MASGLFSFFMQHVGTFLLACYLLFLSLDSVSFVSVISFVKIPITFRGLIVTTSSVSLCQSPRLYRESSARTSPHLMYFGHVYTLQF